MRWLVLILLALGIHGRAAGQCERSAQLLQSESLRDKAWGAHQASRCPWLAGDVGAELARLQPELLARLVSDSEGFWVAHALLDALMQLR